MSKPANACDSVSPPPKYANYTGNWILLARRDNCSFMVKVLNAQKAGYQAVIIHNVQSNDISKYYCYFHNNGVMSTKCKKFYVINVPILFMSDILMSYLK